MTRLLALGILGLGVELAACAPTPVAKPAVGADEVFSRPVAGADTSYCDFKGRKDRHAVVTASMGTGQANVRRVYAVGINQKDGRRILRCREADTDLDGVKDVIRTFNEKGELIAEQADSNYDGKIDTWLQFVRNKVAKAELDNNADGKPDERKEYVAGVLSRVQRDVNFDGRMDAWEVYEEGRLNRIGQDLDGDEKVDRWYRDAELVRRDEAEARAETGASEGD
jgi:hypothetical protein